MDVANAVRVGDCHRSTIGTLIRKGKLNARKLKGTRGRGSWDILSTDDEIKNAVKEFAPRSGFARKKTTKKYVNGSGKYHKALKVVKPVANKKPTIQIESVKDALAFIMLGADTRKLLLALSKVDVETLTLLVSLVK